MKKLNNEIHSEDVELPVIYTTYKYKLKNGQPILDENNQPIVLSEKEVDLKHTFRKYNITVKAQTFKNNSIKPDANTSEIFEVTSNKVYRVRMPYHKLAQLLKFEDEPFKQIGFDYKYRK